MHIAYEKQKNKKNSQKVSPKKSGGVGWGGMRMSDCLQGIDPCKCEGKGHQFQRLGW
jgi:hypothetical protein